MIDLMSDEERSSSSASQKTSPRLKGAKRTRDASIMNSH